LSGESEEGEDLRDHRQSEWKAKLLRVGADAGRSENGYLIEKIGEPFTDQNGQKMVRITLAEHPTQ
jgi:hypothetical protein